MSNHISRWPVGDRPREKLLDKGPRSLSNSELLAILLRTGTKGTSALDLSRSILNKFTTFRNMAHTDVRDWQNIKGLGAAKIAHIQAALEIGRRFREDETLQAKPKITSAQDIVDILMSQMRDLKTELFKVIYLNGNHQIISIENESTGTVNQAQPIIREIIHRALQKFATAIICAHNHPSGDTKPSQQDQKFTQDLQQACKIMNIRMLDHIIIGDGRYYSFQEKGVI